jgi:hypothetical protein
MQKTTTKLPLFHYNKVLPLLAFHSKSNFESIYNILLQHFVDNALQECFGCLVLCNRITMEKDFFDKIGVSYTKWNVWWAFTYVILLINNGKLSLMGALKTCGGDVLKIMLSYIYVLHNVMINIKSWIKLPLGSDETFIPHRSSQKFHIT